MKVEILIPDTDEGWANSEEISHLISLQFPEVEIEVIIDSVTYPK